MAADDIFHVQVCFEGPTRPGTFGLYYQETTPEDAAESGTFTLADAFDTAISTLILNALSAEWWFTCIIVSKIDPQDEPKWRLDNAVQVGLRAGESLPANNALVYQLNQGLYTAKHDGRFFYPGLAESDTDIGVMSASYMTTLVTPILSALLAAVPQTSGGPGRWQLGVINQTILNAAPPAKDWQGAFSPVVATNASPIIMTNRGRQTRVRGRAI